MLNKYIIFDNLITLEVILKTLKKLTKFILRLFTSRLHRTAATWDAIETSVAPEYWGNFQVVHELTQKRITGDPNLSWYTMQIKKRVNPFGRVLAFGDGKGMAAEAAIVRKDTTEILYFNISNEECQRFLKLVNENKITIPAHCIIGDANTYNFCDLGNFDTIISVGAFHHMKNFKRIFSQLNDILAPDGLIYVDEFVGPRKWSFDRRVRRQINELLSSLPATLVLDRRPVRIWDFFLLWLRANDPSEAIRSDKLRAAIEHNFIVKESDHFGGSLLFPFFQTSYMRPCRLNIPNWHNTEEGISKLKHITVLENQLIESGILSKNYIYYILQKKIS